MTGNLDEAITSLLQTALPGFFSGDPPPVGLTVTRGLFEVDPNSAESVAGEPRPDDRSDSFPFDPENPPASFTLSRPPYPGPRRVRLTTDNGDRVPLKPDEVVWDAVDSRIFSLNLRPNRELAGVTGVQVLYGVVAIFTTLKADQTLTILLQTADAAQLEQAEALAIGVVELNRQSLIDQAPAAYSGGDYGAAITVKNFKLVQSHPPADDQRQLTYLAEIELKATRALREDEGRPITHIRTPGRPLDPDRAVDVHIDVDA